MHLPQTAELLVKQPNHKVAFAANVGVGANERMRRLGVGGAKFLELFASALRISRIHFVPHHAVHAIKKVHHMDALGQLYSRQTHFERVGRMRQVRRLGEQIDLSHLTCRSVDKCPLPPSPAPRSTGKPSTPCPAEVACPFARADNTTPRRQGKAASKPAPHHR